MRVETVEECVHGHPRELPDGDWSTCIDPGCDGGTRRRLTEGTIRHIEWCETHEASFPDESKWCHEAVFLLWVHTQRDGPMPDLCSVVSLTAVVSDAG